MANTKIPVELSSTPGIVDNSDATAITIDSSERVIVGQTAIATGFENFAQLETSHASAGGLVINTQTASTSNYGRLIFTKGNAAGGEGLIRYNTGDYHMSFWTAATQRLRLDSDGLKFGTDTAAANALDDYEEGSWTPTLPNGGTVLVRTATYTKVGRHVMAYMYCQFAPTNNSSTFNIGGLPYTVVNNSNYYGGGSLSYSGTEDTSSFSDPLQHYNSTYIYFHYLTGSSVSVKNSQFGGRTINLIIQAHYETAA